VKPLFFEFPEDKNCFEDSVLNEQFLFGKDLMVAPLLESGQNSKFALFPGNDQWNYFYNGLPMKISTKQSEFIKITCEEDDFVPVFIREGAIVHQNSKMDNVLRT
jgi:alpha-glucosidase (family GH31 glycosyl hydrolase)